MNNISQIMKQAKAMQEKMNELQQKVEKEEIEGLDLSEHGALAYPGKRQREIED